MLRLGLRHFQTKIFSIPKHDKVKVHSHLLCQHCQQFSSISRLSPRDVKCIVSDCLTTLHGAVPSVRTCGSSILLRSRFDVHSIRQLSSSTPPPPPSSKNSDDGEESSQELPGDSSSSEGIEKRKNKLLKVIPRLRKDSSLNYQYTGNIYISPARALKEYLLKPSDLDHLPKYSRRSPYASGDKITLYLRSEVEEIALAKWGSFDLLNKEKARQEQEWHERYDSFHLRSLLGESSRPDGNNPDDPVARALAEGGGQGKEESFLSSGATKVVLSAIIINGANSLLKLAAWLYSGSHSMFAEFIHSVADTMNQIVLGVGLYHSFKKPDTDHPYGYSNLRHISSLISGVGIFFLGAGLSWYHSFQGFMHPTTLTSLTWCIASLVGSFMSEGATLLIAINQIQKSSKALGMSFKEYVQSGADPNVTVVLLEDLAAVVGVVIAGSCISISHVTGSHLPDAVGSAIIGTLLGGVAGFIIYNNTTHLVGRSIPLDERHEISQLLETDRMIRSLHDIKATQMGGSVRYKAEVDFDGREITRAYLYKQDLDLMLAEANKLQTVEDLENFMLNHGDKIIDTLGGEVDRIEKALKTKHPEIRHVDLEAL